MSQSESQDLTLAPWICFRCVWFRGNVSVSVNFVSAASVRESVCIISTCTKIDQAGESREQVHHFDMTGHMTGSDELIM